MRTDEELKKYCRDNKDCYESSNCDRCMYDLGRKEALEEMSVKESEERQMKKLFVSVPMKGRTDKAIDESISKMHKIAEIIFGEELEVIHNHYNYENAIVGKVNPKIFMLGLAIEKMADCDFFIGVEDIKVYNYGGCYIEDQVASMYGLKSTYISELDSAIFPDLVRETKWSINIKEED